MKVALLLTGYMRNWEKHLPNIKENIVDKYSADVYITSYSYSELFKGSGLINVDKDKLIKEYQPKNYIFRDKETLPEFDFKDNGLERNGREWSYRILKQWYTIYLALDLFDPEDYDVVIKCRSDFSTKNFNIKPDKDLVIPAWKYHPGPCEPNESYIDYFVHGNGTYMKKYFKTYEKLKELHDNDWGDISLGETIIKSYIDRYIGAEHVTYDYDMDWLMRDEIWASEKAELFPLEGLFAINAQADGISEFQNNNTKSLYQTDNENLWNSNQERLIRRFYYRMLDTDQPIDVGLTANQEKNTKEIESKQKKADLLIEKILYSHFFNSNH